MECATHSHSLVLEFHCWGNPSLPIYSVVVITVIVISVAPTA